jgi:precorrin-8X/cobalt-precorrin-8 methylmutase
MLSRKSQGRWPGPRSVTRRPKTGSGSAARSRLGTLRWLLRFQHDPVPATLAALARNAPIFTDIRMVNLGIQKKGHSCPIICALDYGQDMAATTGITRTSAGFLALKEQLNGSIIVIGNAPSSLLSVCRLIESGIRPAVVIGTPVGFVNAAESKVELRKLAIPSISNEGTRGGTPVAVAAINECVTMFVEGRPAESAVKGI